VTRAGYERFHSGAGSARVILRSEGGNVMTRKESLWTDLASLAVAGASLAFLAFMLTVAQGR